MQSIHYVSKRSYYHCAPQQYNRCLLLGPDPPSRFPFGPPSESVWPIERAESAAARRQAIGCSGKQISAGESEPVAIVSVISHIQCSFLLNSSPLPVCRGHLQLSSGILSIRCAYISESAVKKKLLDKTNG